MSPENGTGQGPQGRPFSYEQAFARHLGLIAPDEQARLRRARVAILGMGGVGGIHLVTLARLGIGSFRIADPDGFELANFNRQYGANMRTLGRNKAEVMAEEARAINPELDLRVFAEAVTPRTSALCSTASTSWSTGSTSSLSTPAASSSARPADAESGP